jgi:membrane-associated phospholipid phosphatase
MFGESSGGEDEINNFFIDLFLCSQSFPSGHASTAFCGLIFLAVSFSLSICI